MTDKMMRGFAQRDLARKLGERNTRSAVGSRSRQRKARSSSALPTNHRWPTAQAARPLRRYLRARAAGERSLPSYTISGDTTPQPLVPSKNEASSSFVEREASTRIEVGLRRAPRITVEMCLPSLPPQR